MLAIGCDKEVVMAYLPTMDVEYWTDAAVVGPILVAFLHIPAYEAVGVGLMFRMSFFN